MVPSEAEEQVAPVIPGETAESPVDPGHAASPKMPPLWLFLILPLPVAITVPLSFLLRQEGVSVQAIANEVALVSLPNMLYFLWAPLVDVWLRRRTWLVLSSGLSALATAAVFFMHTLASPAAVALLFFAQAVVLMASSAAGGIKAEVVPPHERARVSGLAQAGNMGGAALSSGGLIALAARWSRPAMGWLTGMLVFVPSLAALIVDEPPPASIHGSYGKRMREFWVEFKATFLRLDSLPSLLLLISPLGSGAAINLLAGVSQDYGLSTDQTAMLNGLGGGLLTAAGAMLLVLLPKRADMRVAYAWIGLANALAIGILCVGPPRPISYLVGTVVYFLTCGAAWAVFTAVILQLIGLAGMSGATRYSIAVSLGNLPVTYMAVVDGIGAKHWGTRGLAGIDMVVSGVVSLAFLAWLWITRAGRAKKALEKNRGIPVA